VLSKAKIVIVETTTEGRDPLKMLLKSRYEIFLPETHKEALNIIYKNPIDLLITDMQDEGLPGIDLLRAVKSHDSDMEILIFSDHMDIKTATKALQYGVVDYISHSANTYELIAAVEGALERRKTNLQLRYIFQDLLEKNPELEAHQQSFHFEAEKELILHLARKISYTFLQNYFLKQDEHRNYLEFVRVLSSTLEGKDTYTYGHSEGSPFTPA